MRAARVELVHRFVDAPRRDSGSDTGNAGVRGRHHRQPSAQRHVQLARRAGKATRELAGPRRCAGVHHRVSGQRRDHPGIARSRLPRGDGFVCARLDPRRRTPEPRGGGQVRPQRRVLVGRRAAQSRRHFVPANPGPGGFAVLDGGLDRPVATDHRRLQRSGRVGDGRRSTRHRRVRSHGSGPERAQRRRAAHRRADGFAVQSHWRAWWIHRGFAGHHRRDQDERSFAVVQHLRDAGSHGIRQRRDRRHQGRRRTATSAETSSAIPA